MPRVDNSTVSPCWQQQQIAAQNSYIASVKLGRDVVYNAPCQFPKPSTPPAKVAASEPKTS